MNVKKTTCCICKKEFSGYGNNPHPYRFSGRCCDECNLTHVIPFRLLLATSTTNEQEK